MLAGKKDEEACSIGLHPSSQRRVSYRVTSLDKTQSINPCSRRGTVREIL